MKKSVAIDAHSWKTIPGLVSTKATRYATHGFIALCLGGYGWFFIDRARILNQETLYKIELEHKERIAADIKIAHEAEVNALKQMLAAEQFHRDQAEEDYKRLVEKNRVGAK